MVKKVLFDLKRSSRGLSPAPAGTTAVGAAALTLAPLGITTVEVP